MYECNLCIPVEHLLGINLGKPKDKKKRKIIPLSRSDSLQNIFLCFSIWLKIYIFCLLGDNVEGTDYNSGSHWNILLRYTSL